VYGLRAIVKKTMKIHQEILTKGAIRTFLEKRPSLMYELLIGRAPRRR
jgi:hypothetical protein